VIICVTSDISLKASEHVYGVIYRYIKGDVQLHGAADELIVKFSTVVIDSSDIIDDQVNEIDVFMGEMEDECSLSHSNTYTAL
jgi:predicted metal-dependent peptidase